MSVRDTTTPRSATTVTACRVSAAGAKRSPARRDKSIGYVRFTGTCPRAPLFNLTVAGLLASPGPGLLEARLQWHPSEPFRMIQLRAQPRIRTGFPFESAGAIPAEHHNLAQKYADSGKYPIFACPTDGREIITDGREIITETWIKSVTPWA